MAAALAAGAAAPARAQLQQGAIDGTVLGPDGAPADATVTLLDALGTPLASVAARAGVFHLANVAPGSYSLRADAPPFTATIHALSVSAALPLHVELRLSASAAEQIIVRGDAAQPGSIATRITLAGDAVRRAPARLRSRGLQDAIATAPGWATEDNGLMHVRGVDDGFLYVIDGVPVYERLDAVFGVAPDPALIDSVNVLVGYVPPEFGLKSGGVIEVRTAATHAERWSGAIDAGGGSDATRDASIVAGGPIGRTLALTIGGAGQASHRFLDPVHPDNLHNGGGATSGTANAGWMPSAADALSIAAGFARSDFDVPHGEAQQDAGQDQRQHVRQSWQTVSWQRSISARTIAQASAYRRSSSSSLAGSGRDTPLFTGADRTLRRVGALASVTHARGSHLLKLGADAARLGLDERFTFAVTDADRAADAGLSAGVIAHTIDDPFAFRGTAHPQLLSLFVQDSMRPANRLTIDLGVRADWSRMLARASQWSPRLGVAYAWPSTGTTLRASYGRFFQPPQPENLLLAASGEARALSPFAGDLGEGGADLRPERQTGIDVSVSQRFARTGRLDVSWWRRRVRDAADPNVFLGTTIVFPNTVARGRASGVDARVELPRRRGWSAYASYANARVVQQGPITGGLFLEDDAIEILDGTAFTPDHDQRNVAAWGVTFDQPRGVWLAALTGRHESGTPIEAGEARLDDLRDRPGAGLADFDRGRVRPRTIVDGTIAARVARRRRAEIDVRLAVLNLTGRRFAFNFGNPFSGTHFGPGRSVRAGLRLAFR